MCYSLPCLLTLSLEVPISTLAWSFPSSFVRLRPTLFSPLITLYRSSTHHCFKSFSCNTYQSSRKCCKQKTYVAAKPFRCNTYKKHGGTPLKPNTLLPHASDSCPLALLSPLLSLQCFFYRRCNDFADAFAQRWHVFLRQTLGLDDVMQINRNFRRPLHPVARPVVVERPHQAHRHDGNPELLRHPEAAVLELIHVPVARPLGFRKNNQAGAAVDGVLRQPPHALQIRRPPH